MRPVGKSLLLLLVMGGLTFPKAMARSHEVACNGPDHCPGFTLPDCESALPCHGCPPPEEFPCDHDHPDDDAPLHPHQEGSECPSQSHEHHHHHHQCVCSAANSWLITDTDPLSLHPPQRGRMIVTRECLFTPESPVFLLDRPPIR